MAVRKILAIVTHASECRRLSKASIALAQRLHAHLVVTDVFANMSAVPEDVLVTRRGAQRSRTTVAKVVTRSKHALLRDFESVAKQARIHIGAFPQPSVASACYIPGTPAADPVWTLGRLSDVIVMQRPAKLSGAEYALVENAMFEARRPVLLLPRKAATFAHSTVIAWNGSTEACTSLMRAVGLMNRDAPVHIVQVGHPGADSVPIAEAVEYLMAQGFKVWPRPLPKSREGVAKILLAEAKRLKASLIVAGAYSHSRLQEAITGGVTATLIRQSHIPVLLAR